MADEQREKLRKLSNNIEDKIDRCRQMEKSTRKRLAYLEDWVEKIYGDIDNIADDLVCESILQLLIIFNVYIKNMEYLKYNVAITY